MSLSTHIFVFAIGRGSAAFVRSGLSQGFILDMGGGNLFDPARFVAEHLVPSLDKYKGNSIAQVILSHPHADHIAQCGSLTEGNLYPTLLTCPTDHPDFASCQQVDWSRLGRDDPDKKDLIRTYKSQYKNRKPPMQTIVYDSARTVPEPGVRDLLHRSGGVRCLASERRQ